MLKAPYNNLVDFISWISIPIIDYMPSVMKKVSSFLRPGQVGWVKFYQQNGRLVIYPNPNLPNLT